MAIDCFLKLGNGIKKSKSEIFTEDPGRLSEDLQGLLRVLEAGNDSFDFSVKVVETGKPAGDRITETLTISFSKIEVEYVTESKGLAAREEAFDFAEQLERQLDPDDQFDFDITVTGGGGKSAMIIDMTDTLVSSYNTGGSGGYNLVTDLTEYDLFL